ncbi:aldehyde dehydrogenase family protein [Nocardia sp. NPDC088792]|uniref:aldehyde dehydrogenase family protein n=1 Tax=Nocardia sp. NPDC088792 TaxID=3364332 RepID=UPI003816B3F9
MTTLSSYAAARWWPAAGRPVPGKGSATGAITPGVVLAAALDHAGAMGVPALRDTGFHDRAAVLKELARVVRGHTAEFAAEAVSLGVRPVDTALEVRAAAALLRRYGDLGLRELPAGNRISLGAAEFPGRTATTAVRRMAVPGAGAAVHPLDDQLPILAYLDRFAAAFLAGRPCLILPPPLTAPLLTLVTERVITAELPPGALQFVCGADDLDAVPAPHEVIAPAGVRSGAVAVLGSGAEPGTPAFELFADHVVDSMTRWTGRPAHAVRQILVPAAFVPQVGAALTDRLAAVVAGDPRDPDVTMGPLPGPAHRALVTAQLTELLRDARIRFAAPALDTGDHLLPVLAEADPNRPAPCELGIRGPVAVLLGYGSAAELAAALARGPRRTRCAIVAPDPAAARRLAAAAAPYAEVVVFPDSVIASLDHSDAECLDQVHNHMRVTTFRAAPSTLAGATGTWVRGAPRIPSERHPLHMWADELRPGDSLSAGPRTVTRADIAEFAELTGDHYYLHTDEDAARRNPMFRGIIAHGYLVLSLAAGLFTTTEPGPVLANYGLENLRFLGPVRPGDELTVHLTAIRVTPRPNTTHSEVRWDVEVENQERVTVARYDVLTLMARKP